MTKIMLEELMIVLCDSWSIDTQIDQSWFELGLIDDMTHEKCDNLDQRMWSVMVWEGLVPFSLRLFFFLYPSDLSKHVACSRKVESAIGGRDGIERIVELRSRLRNAGLLDASDAALTCRVTSSAKNVVSAGP